MIKVKCQRSDGDSVVVLSSNKPTIEGARLALKTYQWWEERFSKVYPSGNINMRIWMEYKGVLLDLESVERALNEEYGWWGHIDRILEDVAINKK